MLLLQGSASATPGTGGLPYSAGAGGLPDLSSLFGAAVNSGAGGTGSGGTGGMGLGTGGTGGMGLGAGGMGLGGMGLGSPNLAEMQRQVSERLSVALSLKSLNLPIVLHPLLTS